METYSEKLKEIRTAKVTQAKSLEKMFPNRVFLKVPKVENLGIFNNKEVKRMRNRVTEVIIGYDTFNDYYANGMAGFCVITNMDKVSNPILDSLEKEFPGVRVIVLPYVEFGYYLHGRVTDKILKIRVLYRRG